MSNDISISGPAPLAVNGALNTLVDEAAAFAAKGAAAYDAILGMRDFGIQRLKGKETREWQEAVAKVHPWIKAGGDKAHPTLADFRAWFFKLDTVKGVVNAEQAKEAENKWDWDRKRGETALGMREPKVPKVAEAGTDGETVPTGATVTGDPVLAFTKYLYDTFPGIIAGKPDKAACVSLSSAIGSLADALDTYMAGRGYILDGIPETVPVPVPVTVPMPALWGKFFNGAATVPETVLAATIVPETVPGETLLAETVAETVPPVEIIEAMTERVAQMAGEAPPVPVPPVSKTMARKMARAARMGEKIAA